MGHIKMPDEKSNIIIILKDNINARISRDPTDRLSSNLDKKCTMNMPCRFVLWFLGSIVALASSNVAFDIPVRSSQEQYDVFSGILTRVENQLEAIVTIPQQAVSVIKTYHKNQGMGPNGLHSTGRGKVLSFLYSLIESFDGISLYFGTELGEYFAYFPGEGVYREPGNSGYRLDDPEMNKYFPICVKGDDGSQEDCLMNEGDKFIQCVDDCRLVKCSGDTSHSTCSSDGDNDCDESQIKWCPNYTIEEVGPTNNNTENLRGFVPVSYHCIDSIGRFSQLPGGVQWFNEDLQLTFNNGTCKHWDATPVTRVTTGSFFSCQEDGEETCNSTYTGVIRTLDYDPRLRPWYIGTKEKQVPNWNSPYAFHSWGYNSVQHIGITYSEPFYRLQSETDDVEAVEATTRQVFEGVFAVDYTLQDISSFLISDFGSADDVVVLVFEEAAPYYTVGISTGFNNFSNRVAPLPGQGPKIYRSVLSSDPTILCAPENKQEDCELVRVPATDFRTGDKLDFVANRAVQVQADAGFPFGERVTVKETDDIFSGSYVSQSARYAHAGLEWVILVASPVQRVDTDTLQPGDTSFVILILIAAAGSMGCSILLVLWFRSREKQAVKYGDFLFTSAFVFGCVLLNMSSFVSVGENTDEMCMARMWTFNLCFSLVIAPLYAKVFRIHTILGAAKSMRRFTMDPKQTALRATPIVAVEVLILVIFSITDPPRAQEEIVYGEGAPQQYIQCEHDTNAFLITQGLYSSCLVALGCFLAFLTRNLDAKFGEAKQLLYGMYNITFTGLCFILLLAFADVTPEALHTFRAVAIFWGTVLTCAVFVLPRLFQFREDSLTGGSSRMTISGLMPLRYSSDGMPSQPFQPRRLSEKTPGEDIKDLSSAKIILEQDIVSREPSLTPPVGELEQPKISAAEESS
jgi:7 transmembrane sweet-taste receptor of 3 GCPR